MQCVGAVSSSSYCVGDAEAMTCDTEVKAGGKSSEPCRALSEPLVKLAHVEDSTTQAPFELPGKWDCHQSLPVNLERTSLLMVSQNVSLIEYCMLDMKSSLRDRRPICIST